jgi:hypothetical protein
MLRLNMPIQIVLARHALSTPFHRADKARLHYIPTKIDLMLLRLLVTQTVLFSVFAVLEVCIADIAMVFLVGFEM